MSHVRFGPRVFSPLIRCGAADMLYAAEQLEALRYAHYLKPGGLVVMDDRIIEPVRMPDAPDVSYPEGVPEFLRGKGLEVLVVPAVREAMALGEKRMANVVLLGAVAERLPFGEGAWQGALAERLPAKALEANRRAFAAGRRLGRTTPAIAARD